MANVNSKSTKQEIMDVLESTKIQLEEKENQVYNLMKELETQRQKNVLISGNQSISDNLFSEELNNKLKDLNESIEIQSKKLKELYEIEKEFQNLLIVTTTSKELQDKLNEDLKQKKTDINNQIKILEDEYLKKQNGLKAEFNQLKENLDLERNREIEQYEYDIKRKKEKENDIYIDEKYKRELEITKKEEIAQQLLSEAESKIGYIKELEEKIEKIPELIVIAKQEGVTETTKELGKEYGYRKSLSEKEFEYEKQLLKNNNDSLQKELDKLNEEKQNLQSKLDSAYSQLSDLATETVKSSGGVKILGNSSNTEIRK